MTKILDPQYGNNSVGREEEIKELKEKIENNGIVVITGERGIGKINLIKVVEKDFENQKECHYIDSGLLFSSETARIFLPDRITTGVSSSVAVFGFGGGGGTSWKPREPSVLEYMKESEEKIIFVESAHKLKEEEFTAIFAAIRRNERLRFVLEIATPYKPEDKLGVDSYEVVKLKELSNEDIERIVIRECANFSDALVKGIISLSKGYPYVARSLAYVCDRKNVEKEMFEFLETLRDDDMKYNLDKIHKEISNTLSEDSQVVVKGLAIAPPLLTLKLIEAFCKGIPDNLDTALSDLFDRGILVKEEDGKGFYRIYHPLFREYLKSEKIQPTAIEHWKEYYRKAMEDVKAEFDSIYILLEVLNEPDLFKELVKITENFVVINSTAIQAHTWGRLEQAIFTWNALLEKAEEKQDKEWKAAAIGNIGLVYQTKGELDKALEHYEKALNLHKELGRKEGMAADLGNIGIVYQTKGELDKALEYYEKALKLDEELRIKEGMAADLGNIGVVHKIKGELDKALEYLEKALKLAEELGRKEWKAAAIGNIGNIYQIKGELDKALEYYERALKLDEELRIKEGIAVAIGNIGVVYETKGELDKALEYYEKALELDEELERKEGIATNLGNIGDVCRIKGELDKALKHYEKSLRIFRGMGNRIGTAQTLVNIGNVFALKGDKKRALDYYHEAKSLAKGSSVFESVSERLKRLKEEQNTKNARQNTKRI